MKKKRQRRRLNVEPEKKKRGRGRPSMRKKRLQRTIEQEYIEAVGLGLNESDASALAGVDCSTTRRWRDRDAQLCAAHRKAAAESIVPLLRKVRKIALRCGDPAIALRAATWILSRRSESFRAPPSWEDEPSEPTPSATFL